MLSVPLLWVTPFLAIDILVFSVCAINYSHYLYYIVQISPVNIIFHHIKSVYSTSSEFQKFKAQASICGRNSLEISTFCSFPIYFLSGCCHLLADLLLILILIDGPRRGLAFMHRDEGEQDGTNLLALPPQQSTLLNELSSRFSNIDKKFEHLFECLN